VLAVCIACGSIARMSMEADVLLERFLLINLSALWGCFKQYAL